MTNVNDIALFIPCFHVFDPYPFEVYVGNHSSLYAFDGALIPNHCVVLQPLTLSSPDIADYNLKPEDQDPSENTASALNSRKELRLCLGNDGDGY